MKCETFSNKDKTYIVYSSLPNITIKVLESKDNKNIEKIYNSYSDMPKEEYLELLLVRTLKAKGTRINPLIIRNK